MTKLTSYQSSGASSPQPSIISFQQIEEFLIKLLSSPEQVTRLLRSQARAYKLLATTPSKCSNLPIQTIGQPPNPPLESPTAQMCIKTGYVDGDSIIVSKVAGGGGTNNAPNTGCVMVYSQQTLKLKCILCDEGLLTEVRTAAAGALVTQMAVLEAGGPQLLNKIGVVGGGVQAVWQLRLLMACGVLNPRKMKVVIKTRSSDSAVKFIELMRDSTYEPDRDIQFELFDESKDKRFKDCQVIYTVTPARECVLSEEDISVPRGCENQPFLHITSIGSDSPGKMEVSPDILDMADKCYVDLISQSQERGEFQSSRWEKHTRGSSSSPPLINIGTLELMKVNAVAPGEGEGLFTVFDSSGLALQDVEMAKVVFEGISLSAYS